MLRFPKLLRRLESNTMRYDKKIRKAEKKEGELVACQAELHRLTESHKNLKKVVESLMHESRHFSAEIASYAEELCRQCDATTDRRVKDLADTVFYTAGLLSSRMVFSDYELNPQSIIRQVRLRTGIYKKFDKARHILMRKACQKKIDIKFSGTSIIEIDALQAFELVPFVVLENAIKYSPPSRDITVTFSEVMNKELEVIVESQGPELSNEEHSILFTRGMRSSNAVITTVPGEGLGLYLAKTLCNLNKIKISVDSPVARSGFSFNSVPYSPFVVRLQIKR